MRVNGYTIMWWRNVAINGLELIFSLKTLIQQSALNCSLENTWLEGPLPHSFFVYVMLSLAELGSGPRVWPFCCQFMWRLCFQSYLCSNLKPNQTLKVTLHLKAPTVDLRFSTLLHWGVLVLLLSSGVTRQTCKLTVIDLSSRGRSILSIQIKFGRIRTV